MSEFKRLSETEMKLMKAIWELNRPVKSNELSVLFLKKEGKNWKGQTISTFLSRLVDKGMLFVEREGRTNIYYPCLTLKGYKKKEAQSLLDSMYQGSVKNFLATLYDDKVGPDELDEIKKWFSNK